MHSCSLSYSNQNRHVEREVNYVQALKDRMEKQGFTIPGKDLTDPDVCEAIFNSLDAPSAPMRFNDSHKNTDDKRCTKCRGVIPHGDSYLYQFGEVGELAYHHDCYPWAHK